MANELSISRATEDAFLSASPEALAAGLDPIEVRKAKVREAHSKAEETFKAIADEWVARLELEGRAPKSPSEKG